MTSEPGDHTSDRVESQSDALPTGLSIVVHSGTLGDLVLTWPLLRTLADHGPVWAVTGWSAARLAARRVAGVTAVDGDQPRWARLFGPRPPDDPELAQRLASAARIVSFVAGASDAWAANVRERAPRARLAFVHPRPPSDWAGHVTDWLDAQLVRAGFPAGTARPTGGGPAGSRNESTGDGADDRHLAPTSYRPTYRPTDRPTDRPIVLHPGSGALVKCWPAERFWTLAQALTAAGRHVQVVLGEAEQARWHEAEIRRWRAAFDVQLPETLSALEALLGDALAYVGNDSGPTHLAAAIGVPTVALFGPTSSRMWRPIGPFVTVLAPPSPAGMDWLAVDPVARAVDAALRATADRTAAGAQAAACVDFDSAQRRAQ